MTEFSVERGEGRRFTPSLFTLRGLLIVTLAIGIVQIVAYWLTGMTVSPDGTQPIPQPDTLLYCQAARRIAEGAPFSFSSGSAVSTGTTSVLHPFLLAVPYLLGCSGERLLFAGFFLNAVFYLVFLGGWTVAFERWSGRPRGRLLACLFLALFGQTAFAALAQSDIGLWLAVSGLLAAGCARRWFGLTAGMLVLAPWIRPEGGLCVVAYALVGVLAAVLRMRERYAWRNWILAGTAGLSLVGVFVLNHALTGDCQFSSVAHKGHFANLPLLSAVHSTACDLLDILRTLFLGGASSGPRAFHFLPLWGGVFVGVGLVSLRNRRIGGRGIGVLALAGLGGLLTVAQSGWQNTNFDRYLAWIMPLPVFLVSEGAVAVARRLARGTVRWLPLAAVVLFAAMGSVEAVCIYGRNCAYMEGERQFMKACEREMPAGASVGGFGNVGMAYGFSARRFAHLAAIYSPEFASPEETAVVEDLKHNPGKRFDYWLLDRKEELKTLGDDRAGVLGPVALTGPASLELRRADWRAFDRAAAVPKAPRRDMALRARIDVGLPADERTFGYRVFDRYGRRPFDPFLAAGEVEGGVAVEAGRLVVGGDEMRVPTIPGRPLAIVMRTLPGATASNGDGMFAHAVKGGFGSKLALRVVVDGGEAIPVEVALPKTGFGDVVLELPASAIRGESSEIAILGDHVACCYWVFQ